MLLLHRWMATTDVVAGLVAALQIEASADVVQAADRVEDFLAGLGEQLRTGRFGASPVKERLIQEALGKFRRHGIPTVADRVSQPASQVLVLELIFEADFDRLIDYMSKKLTDVAKTHNRQISDGSKRLD